MIYIAVRYNSKNGKQTPFYFIIEMPDNNRWRKTKAPTIGTNVHLVGYLSRREPMGMFVVELAHLDLPRRGIASTTAPATPPSVARDRRAAARLQQRRAAVQITEDPNEELPSPSQGSLSDTPVAGPSRSHTMPSATDNSHNQAVTPSPATPTPTTRGSSKRKERDSD